MTPVGSGALEFHEDLAGRGLEGVDDADAFVGDGLDHGLVAEAQQALQVGQGGGGGHVPLVELEHVGDGADVEAVLAQVGGQVRDGLDVGFHAGPLAVCHEDDAVAAPQDELAAGVVEDLAGHGVEVEPHLEALDGAHVEGQEVEEQRAVGLGGEAHQLAALLGVGLLVDPLDVRGLAAEARTVVDDLAVDLARGVVDEGHGAGASIAEEAVDVFVGDLGEGAFEAAAGIQFLLGPQLHLVEDLLQLLAGLLHPQAHQGKAGVLVEDHHQDAALAHDGDVQVVLLAFVEKQAEFLFPDEFCQAIRGRDVAGGEGGQAGGVDALDVAGRGDLLAVFIHQEDHLGGGVLGEAANDLLEELVFLLEQHEIKFRHEGLRWNFLLEDTAFSGGPGASAAPGHGHGSRQAEPRGARLDHAQGDLVGADAARGLHAHGEPHGLPHEGHIGLRGAAGGEARGGLHEVEASLPGQLAGADLLGVAQQAGLQDDLEDPQGRDGLPEALEVPLDRGPVTGLGGADGQDHVHLPGALLHGKLGLEGLGAEGGGAEGEPHDGAGPDCAAPQAASRQGHPQRVHADGGKAVGQGLGAKGFHLGAGGVGLEQGVVDERGEVPGALVPFPEVGERAVVQAPGIPE